MNIWALDKDQSIRHLLLLLQAQLGADTFVVDETEASDECAIYLHHPDDMQTRAYIYTLGQSEGRYGLHLEYPAYTPNLFEAQENQTLDALVDSLAVHFDIAIVAPLPGR